MNLSFDHTNLLSGMVGGHGIEPVHLERESPAAVEGLRRFQSSVEAGHYGFPHLPFDAAMIKSIRAYAAGVRGSYDTVCLVGIGGSALGAWALDCGLRGPHPVQGAFSTRHPRLVVLDNVDPTFTASALASMNPRKTLVAAVAKSGATAETIATFLIVREWLGGKGASRIAVVTSPGKGDLGELAAREKYPVFELPVNVGGRFSVLSAVGLLPAALIGIDIARLCRGAAEITHRCWMPDVRANIALHSALCHYLLLTRHGKSIQVAFPYANRLWGAAFWFRQLWAESIGKAKTRDGKVVNAGQTPVAALGATDQHSQVQLYIEGPNDKVFTFWSVGRFADSGRIPKARHGLPAFDYLAGQSLAKLIDAERRATAAALTEASRPNCNFTLGRLDEAHLGAFLQLLEFQTAFMGELLNVNAFDQEGVELGKVYTFGLMGRPGYEPYLRRFAEYESRRTRA